MFSIIGASEAAAAVEREFEMVEGWVGEEMVSLLAAGRGGRGGDQQSELLFR